MIEKASKVFLYQQWSQKRGHYWLGLYHFTCDFLTKQVFFRYTNEFFAIIFREEIISNYSHRST